MTTISRVSTLTWKNKQPPATSPSYSCFHHQMEGRKNSCLQLNPCCFFCVAFTHCSCCKWWRRPFFYSNILPVLVEEDLPNAHPFRSEYYLELYSNEHNPLRFLMKMNRKLIEQLDPIQPHLGFYTTGTTHSRSSRSIHQNYPEEATERQAQPRRAKKWQMIGTSAPWTCLLF